MMPYGKDVNDIGVEEVNVHLSGEQLPGQLPCSLPAVHAASPALTAAALERLSAAAALQLLQHPFRDP
jgi:hypothetical protein